MKKGIHPTVHKDVKVIHNGKHVMTVLSTSQELNVEIWSGNHPFYTGKEMLVDTDNRVDSFMKRFEKKTDTNVSKRVKRNRRSQKQSDSNSPVTLQDMLKNIA